MRRGLIRLRMSLTVVVMLIAAALLLIQPEIKGTASAAAIQGKGGTIKPAPTPTPAAIKTTPPKRSAPPARTTRATSSRAGDTNAVEIAFWNSIKESTDPEDFRAYLKKYPAGQFVDLANNRIRALEAANARPTATPTPTEQPKPTPTTTVREAKSGQPASTPAPDETKADAPGHFEKALKLRNSDREVAEAEYRIAIRLDPDKAEYHQYLSWNLGDQCKNMEAETEMKEVVRLGPNYDTYLYYSHILQTNGKYDEGLTALKEAARLIKPGYAPWHREAGIVLAKMGRWAEADAEFKEAIRLGDPAEEHQWYAVTLANLKKYVEAEVEMKEAIRLAKKEDVYRYHDRLGDIYRYEKKWAEAVEEKREAIRTHSTSWTSSWWDLAKALEGQGKLAEAEEVFKEGMRSFPNEPVMPRWYGTWLLQQKRFTEAEAQYREAIRLTPSQDPYLFAALADALTGQKRFAEAETEYRKALHLDPTNSTARSGLPVFFEQQNKLKEAEAEYQNLLRIDCAYGFAHGAYGDFLSRQKRWKEAETQYREAARLNPTNADYPQKLQAAIDAQKK